ncbi:MAG: hypothetical protein WCT27_03160 [Patescibacteria group bacterium]|jgi:hypothetical protein
MKKSIIITIIAVVIVVVGGGIFLFLKLGDSISVNQTNNTNVAVVNQAITNNTNEPTNQAVNIVSNVDTTVTGTVFVKGYGTPSESYGVLTTENSEVGLGKYDSMKEQFRSYVGDKVSVTFSNICRSTGLDCCLTVFYYCGTVKSWEPLTTNQ